MLGAKNVGGTLGSIDLSLRIGSKILGGYGEWISWHVQATGG